MFDSSVDLDRRFAALRSGLIVPTDIADAAIQTRHLADGSVTSAKILDGTIATGDLATAIYGSPVATGDALANGSNTTLARSDHVHRVPGLKAPAAAFPGSPVEGDLFYETDTDKLWVWNSPNWIELGRTGAWTAYTPTFIQTVTVTKTVTSARWTRFGRTIFVAFSLVVTGSGTAGGDVRVGLPFTAGVADITIGSGWIYDSSTVIRYAGSWELAGTPEVRLVTDVSGGNTWGVAPSIGLASGDVTEGTLLYEAAASV